jgi:fumarate hydratase class I
MSQFREWGVELIKKAATDLPADVESALKRSRDIEVPGSTAQNVLDNILTNIALARAESTPLCQDTGLVNFFVTAPSGTDFEALKGDLIAATREATKRGYLRPNVVQALTGKNTGDNVGENLPYFLFEVGQGPEIIVNVMLKGGGSENVGAQYRLPDARINAGRDLQGVERAMIDAVFNAQGFGCAPGVLGVCIGGDRAGSFMGAKKQLLRPIDDVNPDPELAAFEARLVEQCNKLGVGPMGFGGKNSVLAAKVGLLHRHTACFYVSLTYMCWANRRAKLIVADGKATLV